MQTPPATRADILLVDDKPAVRSFMGRVLTNAGYATTSAVGGPEALALLDMDGEFDLLVTDFLMPGMQGDELARRFRQAASHVKVLYVTAHRDQLFESKSLLGNDEAFLDKPFAMRGLLEAVSSLLDGRLESHTTGPPDEGLQARTSAAKRSLRVLLVEDVDADAHLIVAELERSRRFEVEYERVDTKVTLISAFERQTWDLIISGGQSYESTGSNIGIVRVTSSTSCWSVSTSGAPAPILGPPSATSNVN